MSKKNTRKRPGVTRGKLALVGVLCLLMAVVWGNALLGGDAPANSAKRAPRPRSISHAVIKSPATDAPQAGAAVTAAQPLADWPEMPLTSAVLNDPFAKPSWAITKPAKPAAGGPEEQGGSQAATRKELTRQGASMIVISGEKKIATVGELEVRIGDNVAGYRVVDITPDGVVLDHPLEPSLDQPQDQ